MLRSFRKFSLLSFLAYSPSALADIKAQPISRQMEWQEAHSALSLGSSSFFGQQISHLGLSWLHTWNPGFVLGLYGDSIIGKQPHGSEDQQIEDVSLWHAGVATGFTQAIAGPVVLRALVKGGYGQLNFRDVREANPETKTKNLAVFTPEFATLVQVTDTARVGLSAGYRMAGKVNFADRIKAKDVSGLTVSAELSLELE